MGSSAALLSLILAATQPAEISLDTLLTELVDLERLTELSDPAYVTRQFASYDRASKSPTENWFANHDRGQYLRVETHGDRQEYVMMDAAGPGCVVRIWSANPAGVLRFYLDGAEEPVLEAPMTDLLGGKVDGFPEPLAGVRARGWNLYFPIPYAKHCKITSDAGDFYYQVNYRTYAAGARVRTLERDQLRAHAERIGEVAKRLASPRSAGASVGRDAKTRKVEYQLGQSDRAALFSLEGERELTALRFRIQNPDPVAVARGLILRIAFDGEETVVCPLGDFFGTAPGLNAYEALPLGVTPGPESEMWCHFRMPFRQRADVSIQNLGKATARLTGEIVDEERAWTDRSLHFHAGWRGEKGVPTRPFTDWRHLECQGNGRFVGGHLHIQNPVKNWWGEGDEKIYVDGETFPSHFGTGTEDYYGYAWCSPEVFHHAYHNQPRCDGPGNYGNTSVNRFHILDDIPFTRSFVFDIENWHWHETTTTNRAAVSYWYARPGGSDTFAPITAADVELEVLPDYQPHRVVGAIEGEEMEVVESSGQVRAQSLGDRYSNETQLWWTHAKPGARLRLSFVAEEQGRRRVFARFTRAPDYGIHQLTLNETPIGKPVDLYRPETFAPTEEIELGGAMIRKGPNLLEVVITGKNERSVDFMFGLDYLRLE